MDHEHSLQQKPAGAPFTCNGCGQLGFGSSFHCQHTSHGNYVLHEECAYPDTYASHPFFEKSSFEFHKNPPGDSERYCDACGKDILGFSYHCSTTGYDLHPCCLKLKKGISDESGSVTWTLCKKVRSKCVKCKHERVVGDFKGWCYYDENYCYHVSCFQDLILDIWKRGYFSQGDGSMEAALKSMEMDQDLRIARRRRNMRKYSIKIAIVVFKLIFSAIFGNPVSAFTAILEALVSDHE